MKWHLDIELQKVRHNAHTFETIYNINIPHDVLTCKNVRGTLKILIVSIIVLFLQIRWQDHSQYLVGEAFVGGMLNTDQAVGTMTLSVI